MILRTTGHRTLIYKRILGRSDGIEDPRRQRLGIVTIATNADLIKKVIRTGSSRGVIDKNFDSGNKQGRMQRARNSAENKRLASPEEWQFLPSFRRVCLGVMLWWWGVWLVKGKRVVLELFLLYDDATWAAKLFNSGQRLSMCLWMMYSNNSEVLNLSVVYWVVYFITLFMKFCSMK